MSHVIAIFKIITAWLGGAAPYHSHAPYHSGPDCGVLRPAATTPCHAHTGRPPPSTCQIGLHCRTSIPVDGTYGSFPSHTARTAGALVASGDMELPGATPLRASPSRMTPCEPYPPHLPGPLPACPPSGGRALPRGRHLRKTYCRWILPHAHTIYTAAQLWILPAFQHMPNILLLLA